MNKGSVIFWCSLIHFSIVWLVKWRAAALSANANTAAWHPLTAENTPAHTGPSRRAQCVRDRSFCPHWESKVFEMSHLVDSQRQKVTQRRISQPTSKFVHPLHLLWWLQWVEVYRIYRKCAIITYQITQIQYIWASQQQVLFHTDLLFSRNIRLSMLPMRVWFQVDGILDCSSLQNISSEVRFDIIIKIKIMKIFSKSKCGTKVPFPDAAL